MRLYAVGLLIVVSIALGALYGYEAGQPSIKVPFGSHQDKGRKAGSTVITWHGGRVLRGKVPTYVIYYGEVPSGTQDILHDFLSNLGGSPQFGVNITYYDSVGSVAGSLEDPVIATDNLSQRKTLNSNSIPKIIQAAIANGLNADPSGVYFVITAPDVKVAGFCTSFCAYHTRTTINGVDIKYALIPDPGQACTGCDGNAAVFGQSITPNGDRGADEMTDAIFHELSEAVTDPDLNAWYTSSGAENADLCNYNYGTTYTAKNGSTANANLGKRDYLIQTLWENTGTGACANVYP